MKRLLLLIVLLPLLAAACGGQTAASQDLGPTPTVRVVMVASDPASFTTASGRPQLVEFFAYWCLICQKAAPAVHKAEQAYGQQVGFVFLDTDDPATREFKRELGYAGLPTFVLIDGDGTILKHWAGAVAEETLFAALDAALAGKPVP